MFRHLLRHYFSMKFWNRSRPLSSVGVSVKYLANDAVVLNAMKLCDTISHHPNYHLAYHLTFYAILENFKFRNWKIQKFYFTYPLDAIELEVRSAWVMKTGPNVAMAPQIHNHKLTQLHSNLSLSERSPK